ncbi:hypothetical protein EV426DRAFT_574546 [Tirmania nivea]|nr:hypothetical protein EV426DRAFT_574546 [Tirmania nivea]
MTLMATLAIQHHKRNPILEPPNPSCNKNITLSQSNSYYPNPSGAIWTNCCDKGTGSSSCHPIKTFENDCPAGYYSCADSDYHEEMCSIKYFASQDGSGVYGYGEMLSRTLQQKCCPAQFSCGGSFDAPCIYIGVQQNLTEPAILTNPMYVNAINAYPGCDRNKISPAAVGGIVAIAIVGVVLIGGVLLWLVKKRLHRDPNRQARKRRKSLTTSACRAKAADLEYGESEIGTVSTRDDSGGSPQPTKPPKEHRNIAHSRSRSAAATSNGDYEMGETKSKMFAKGDGEFNAVELDPQLPSSVLDFAGITVTSEIQVIREHGEASTAAHMTRAESDGYSSSSRATSERNYEPAPLVPSNVEVRPLSSASQESHHRKSLQSGFRRMGPPF